jgi:hypothetical protein
MSDDTAEIATACASALLELAGVKPHPVMVTSLATTLVQSFKKMRAVAQAMNHSEDNKSFIVYCSGVTSGAALSDQVEKLSKVLDAVMPLVPPEKPLRPGGN